MKNLLRFIAKLVLPAYLVCGTCVAEVLPEFWHEYSAWHATDVLVVTEGRRIDGRFTILDVWKGAQPIDGTISISDFAKFADPKSRTTGHSPEVLTGQRMVLFLINTNRMGKFIGQPNVSAWLPAAAYEKTDNCAVWIERGMAFAFQQGISPGPCLLENLNLSETALRKRVIEIREAQRELARVAVDADQDRRARIAVRHLLNSGSDACSAAFQVLAGSGKAAVPYLRPLLDDKSYAKKWWLILHTLAVAGGPELGNEYLAMLTNEHTFWRSRAPGLETGWWNYKGITPAEAEELRNRYMRILGTIDGLRLMKFEAARSEVEGVRDFWRSLPQIYDEGRNSVSAACDLMLQSLDSKSH